MLISLQILTILGNKRDRLVNMLKKIFQKHFPVYKPGNISLSSSYCSWPINLGVRTSLACKTTVFRWVSFGVHLLLDISGTFLCSMFYVCNNKYQSYMAICVCFNFYSTCFLCLHSFVLIMYVIMITWLDFV